LDEGRQEGAVHRNRCTSECGLLNRGEVWYEPVLIERADERDGAMLATKVFCVKDELSGVEVVEGFGGFVINEDKGAVALEHKVGDADDGWQSLGEAHEEG
jgi:hypothetical protein